MPRKYQKSVTIPLAEWLLAVREAEKEGKRPTRWIREQIQRGAEVEVPVE